MPAALFAPASSWDTLSLSPWAFLTDLPISLYAFDLLDDPSPSPLFFHLLLLPPFRMIRITGIIILIMSVVPIPIIIIIPNILVIVVIDCGRASQN